MQFKSGLMQVFTALSYDICIKFDGEHLTYENPALK